MRISVFVMFWLVVVAGEANAEHKLESWYTYWALGWAEFSYPTDLQKQIDDAINLGLDNTSVSIDILGFYWPRGENTLFGMVLNGAADRFEEGGESFQVNTYLVSFSAMHFLTNRIGKGPFLRFDVGPAQHIIDTSFMDDYESKWGFGVLLGGGVGFPIASGTRLLVNVNYALRRAEGDDMKTLSINLGGLF